MNIGFAMCGSFCTFSKVFPVVEALAEKHTVYPIFSFVSATTDSRFGKASEFLERAEEICGKTVIKTIAEAEPIGPKKLLDILVIAPCTANFLGKYANGIADDALTTSAMAYEGEVLLAPAMNTRMWRNPAVRHNCETLRARGIHFVGPNAGRLACGDSGEGRMAEVSEILDAVRELLPLP